MGMNAQLLTDEILRAIGGKVTRQRRRAFERFAEALIRHIQRNMVVTATGTDSHGDAVTTTSTTIE